jgi:hypothetical protein
VLVCARCFRVRALDREAFWSPRLRCGDACIVSDFRNPGVLANVLFRTGLAANLSFEGAMIHGGNDLLSTGFRAGKRSRHRPLIDRIVQHSTRGHR